MLVISWEEHTVPLTISYHQFWFLIGWYAVTEIWYLKFDDQKRNENDKNQIFFDEKQKNSTKVYVCIK